RPGRAAYARRRSFPGPGETPWRGRHRQKPPAAVDRRAPPANTAPRRPRLAPDPSAPPRPRRRAARAPLPPPPAPAPRTRWAAASATRARRRRRPAAGAPASPCAPPGGTRRRQRLRIDRDEAPHPDSRERLLPLRVLADLLEGRLELLPALLRDALVDGGDDGHRQRGRCADGRERGGEGQLPERRRLRAVEQHRHLLSVRGPAQRREHVAVLAD